MDSMIAGIIDGFLSAFDSYEITSKSMQEEVNSFKVKLNSFGEANSDPITFYGKLAESGLQEEYSALITKVAITSMQGSSQNQNSQSTALPTVKEFLTQYQVAYDEIKKVGTRPNGEAAYKKLFDVANRTEDMLEAQIIIEKERLLWHIVADDTLDILANKLNEMDPLFEATTATLLAHIEIYKQSKSDEELSYKLERAETKIRSKIATFNGLMAFAATLSNELHKYLKTKATLQSWSDDQKAKEAFKSFMVHKNNLAEMVSYLNNSLEMTIEEFFN